MIRVFREKENIRIIDKVVQGYRCGPLTSLVSRQRRRIRDNTSHTRQLGNKCHCEKL